MDVQLVSQIIANLWGPIAGILSLLFFLIVWCVRLEARTIYLERELTVHKIAQDKNVDTMWDKFDNVMSDVRKVLERISNIEGKIDAIKRDM